MRRTYDKGAYIKKLKDPRWQKRRLQILERDGWTCQRCKSTEITLNIHHRFYYDKEDGVEPWDYPDDALVTLCECCHQYETDRMHWSIQTLGESLKTMGWLSDDIGRLAARLEESCLQEPEKLLTLVARRNHANRTCDTCK